MHPVDRLVANLRNFKLVHLQNKTPIRDGFHQEG
jgi:hypothetical protein